MDPKTGTPGGLEEEHAPVPLGPEHRLWLRLDAELAGAYNGMGHYPDPRAVQTVLEWYREDLVAWFEGMGIEVESEWEMYRSARRLLMELASGRASVSDDPDGDGEDGESKDGSTSARRRLNALRPDPRG